jgi:hypothetical protein
MASASIRVSGPNAERVAAELHAALGKALGPGERVSPVELNRSAELVIAVIGLVFGGRQHREDDLGLVAEPQVGGHQGQHRPR